jgi:diguanylate cyclase (GGDEF)-like protein
VARLKGHDRVLDKWKVWKAKARLKKPETTKTEEREKRRDVLLPTYDKAEFLLDLPNFTSRSSKASPISLVFMDLDKFKSINDGPGGHEAGDRALKEFAEAVLKASGGKGFTYRYGGDELCVLLPNHCLEEALAVAERIRREVSAIRTGELLNGLSTSVGVACFPESTPIRQNWFLSLTPRCTSQRMREATG